MNNNLKEKKEPIYEKISSDMLYADLPYQKVFDSKIVDRIKKNFDTELLQPLEVSYRDGRNNVVDGKHRLTAIREIENETGIKLMIPCYVHFGLTAEEECKMFKDLVENKRNVSRMELYRAAYEAKDNFTVSFVNTIRKAGFVFDFESRKKNGRIHMTATPANIYINLGQKDFERYLKLFNKTWLGNKHFISMNFMNGLYLFFVSYKDEIDDNIFIERLSKLSENEVDAALSENPRKDKTKTIANAIFRKYNKDKRMRKSNILEEKGYFYME